MKSLTFGKIALVSEIKERPTSSAPRWEVNIRNIYSPNGKEVTVQYWTQVATPVFFVLHSKLFLEKKHVI